MSPQSQYNAWDSGEPQARPWECSGPGLNSSTWDSFKTHYNLRKGLATYIYSAFEAQSRTGLPLARALVMDSPEDTDTWLVDDQFLIGSDLMFAPAGMDLSTSTSRSVYFPKTTTSWHYWFENTTSYRPGLVHSVPTPILQAPLFVKGGSVVPFQRPDDSEEHTLELVTFAPATCGNGDMRWSSIYDDDGETTAYKTKAEHWRGRAGYACNSSHHVIRFEVLHSSFVTKWQYLRWRLHHGGELGTEEMLMPISHAAPVHIPRR